MKKIEEIFILACKFAEQVGGYYDERAPSHVRAAEEFTAGLRKLKL